LQRISSAKRNNILILSVLIITYPKMAHNVDVFVLKGA
jgi:hypothetical protein